jgi:hypothetical protein
MAVRTGRPKAFADDPTVRCPGCGRALALSDPRDSEMSGSCLNDNCRQRVTYRRVDGSWRLVARETLIKFG